MLPHGLRLEQGQIVALIGSGRNQLTMDMVDSDEAGDYACADVEVTFELADLLRPEIHEAGMDGEGQYDGIHRYLDALSR